MDHDHSHHNHQHNNPTIKPPNIGAETTATNAILGSTLMANNTADSAEAALNQFDDVHNHQDHQAVHGMKMYFHGGCEEVILFDFWQIESFFGLFCSFIFIFFLATLYEGIKWFRVYFQLWTTDSIKSSAGCCVSMNSVAKGKNHHVGIEEALIDKTTGITSSGCQGAGGCGGEMTNMAGNTLLSQEVYAPTVVVQRPAGQGMAINRWTWLMMYISRELSPSTCRLIETAIYGIQLLLAYWLMLIAMTFNVWLTAAVVLGAAFGHWMFAGLKCAPPRRCFCQSCCNGNGGPEHVDNFASDACH